MKTDQEYIQAEEEVRAILQGVIRLPLLVATALANKLGKNEKITGLLAGPKESLLIATTERVFLYKKELAGYNIAFEIPFVRIESVDSDSKWLSSDSGKIIINKSHTFEGFDKKMVKEFANTLRSRVEASRPKMVTPSQPTSSSTGAAAIKSEQRPVSSEGATRPKAVVQNEGDPPFRIDPQSITHAFIALTIEDARHSDKAAEMVNDLNRQFQPKIWNILFPVKCGWFATDADKNGYPNLGAFPEAMKKSGVTDPFSIVTRVWDVSFDGDRTTSKIWVGFAFRDNDPRIILARRGGCVPVRDSSSISELEYKSGTTGNSRFDMKMEDAVKTWMDGVRTRYNTPRFSIILCDDDQEAMKILKSLSFIDTKDGIQTVVSNIDAPYVFRNAKGICVLCLGGNFTDSQFAEVSHHKGITASFNDQSRGK